VTCLAPVYTHAYLRSLGVDETVADDVKELSNHVSKEHELYDLVINTSGPVAEDFCLGLCSDTGRMVSTLTSIPGLREYGLYTGIAARCVSDKGYIEF
jgi:ribose 5-phosphate isomerase